jgi:guanyl-specific ribonuclease Sa
VVAASLGTQAPPSEPIEQIKQEDVVASRNPQTGQVEFKKVTRTFKHTVHEIVHLELADSKTGKVVESLRGTPEHPFFTPSGKVAMGQLKAGMQVITRRGPPLVVKAVSREHHLEGIAVYNFEVEGDHTYFVGTANGGAWVHNTCPAWITPGSLPDEEAEAIQNSLSHLDAGTQPPDIDPRGWGRVFRNNAGDLPGTPGAGGYREYDVHPAPGILNRGPRRLVVSDSGGSIYYTWTHYGDSGLPAFVRIR